MSQARAKQATLSDVAKQSGVSYQTVSRVINGHPYVAAATRERVLQVIKRLDYRPNRAARSLVTRRSQTIGIVSFGTTYYGPAQMVANIEQAMKARGYSLTFATIEALTPDALQDAVSELTSRGVDALVMITPILDVDLKRISTLLSSRPFVMIDIALGARLPSVVIDQGYGARLATEHLLSLGHKRFAEISGPLSWCDARLRHRGWLKALERAGLEPAACLESDWTAEGGYAAAKELLEQQTGFTALVVGNDQMALGAMRALREGGLRVPEDVSVVGFDDLPEAGFFEPPLTTVRQDFTALGRQSAEYLIALIENPGTPVHQRVLYPELVVRLSTRQLG